MNRMQKISWLIVITIAAAVTCSTAAVTVLYFLFGFPVAWSGLAFLGIAGLSGLAPLIFKAQPGEVRSDERDLLINAKAAKAGFAVSYLVFGILCMGTWAWYQYKAVETIKVGILPMLFMAAGLTVFFTHALATLILYGKGEPDHG